MRIGSAAPAVDHADVCPARAAGAEELGGKDFDGGEFNEEFTAAVQKIYDSGDGLDPGSWDGVEQPAS